ncbi:hypothetical protein C5167_036762 [Papaver somniferum]|uniref:Ubiquinol oxidase n=1 Tax=Papaver somniferum TaxID=3469 RepID=A0A4Y7I4K6_PAPSO|nr:hypothetical protein C5167_036762 [Papaver somniferum]
MSVLHLYETFGWWRRADYLKVHFAESWNEMHHLLIMEELGGNSWWFDCFLAQHIAVFYYFMIVVMYMISPRMAYHFSECVEMHAFETHDKFLKLQGDELKKLLASEVAVKYYIEGDLYLFDKFQTARYPNSRRPKMGKKEGPTKFVRCVSQYKRRRSRALQDVGMEVDRPAEETPAEVETEVSDNFIKANCLNGLAGIGVDAEYTNQTHV